MKRPDAKGWCPGAFRPMMSGDGLVVRVRPRHARLTPSQVIGLCNAARTYGSGLIDLTSRANLQIRGVQETDHQALLLNLLDLGVLDDEPALESRRNILIQPDWRHGDASHSITSELMQRLAEFPELPAKMGFAIDAGAAPVLTDYSADFRIETAATGGLILRADGASLGQPVTQSTAVEAMIEMAHWFVKTGGATNRRMAHHLSVTPLPPVATSVAPASCGTPLPLGKSDIGCAYGVAFGQIDALALMDLFQQSGATGMRVNPWRHVILENSTQVATTQFITDPNDPLLQVDACPGAPFCSASSVETRQLAHRLATLVDGPLHVSGCAKGCAKPRPVQTTLVGRNGSFDLVLNGRPWDDPMQKSISPKTLPLTLSTILPKRQGSL